MAHVAGISNVAFQKQIPSTHSESPGHLSFVLPAGSWTFGNSVMLTQLPHSTPRPWGEEFGRDNPGTCQAFVTTTDLFATIAELLSGKSDLPPTATDSVSFAAALHQPGLPGLRTEAVFRDVSGRKALRFGPWKLVDNHFPREQARRGEVELYNLETDSSETQNLSQENPQVVAEGIRRLQSIMAADRRISD